jgi:hypothetical protein
VPSGKFGRGAPVARQHPQLIEEES